MLKHLEVQCSDICNLLSNGSSQNKKVYYKEEKGKCKVLKNGYVRETQVCILLFQLICRLKMF